ncbi:galanin receptor type 1 [Centropristis striata]|uniref:galanin receptor type 1 n=1 Tax=Centropristis striata TaxID=184440 RepID=UPI0027E05E18|nr:galanin receptor type 1 [Centropristis striata]
MAVDFIHFSVFTLCKVILWAGLDPLQAISGSQACFIPRTPRIEEDAGNHRLVEHPKEFAADIEGPQPPQEVQPALSFLSVLADQSSFCPGVPLVSEFFNGTVFMERSWPEAERWLLVAVLGLEMLMGVVGNCLVLLVKVMCRGRFCCRYWLPFMSLTLSDLGCSLLIISGSLLAMLTGGQRSPWCEVVSLLKFAFITSSIGSIAILCVQRLVGMASTGGALFGIMVTACLASWVTGLVFGSVPVVYAWIRYDPAEMLCAVFWENSYSDMLVYILCAFSISIFLPFLLIFLCSILSATGCCSSRNSDDEADLSAVSPLLVASYILCYTPFVVSELVLLGRIDLSPAPDWLRTLSSVMSYLDCGLNPLIYCSHRDFREAGLALLWTNQKPSSEPVLTSITKHDV